MKDPTTPDSSSPRPSSPPGGESEPDGGGGVWSGDHLAVTVANLTVMAIVAFDGMAIVATLPSIAEDLGDVALLPWVITAFLATSAIATVAGGPVIDAIGVRRTFRATGVWFLLASGAAAAAPNMAMLVAARVAQGLGGGLIVSVVLAAIGLTYPRRLRPRAYAVNSMVWGTLAFGGPAIAAGLLALGGWRGVFVVQLPMTLVGLALGWNTLPSTREHAQPIRTDWPGVALMAGITGAALVVVGQVGVRWWLAGAALTVTMVLGAAYWTHSGRVTNPVLAREHLTRFPLRRIHLTSGLVLIAGLGANNYLPLYVQAGRGRSAEFAAFSVVSFTFGWAAAAVVFSRSLSQRRECDVILWAASAIVPALALAGAGVHWGWPVGVLFAIYLVPGVCVGLVSVSGLTLLQSSSDASEMGRSNAAHQFIRTLAMTFGVAVGGAVLLSVVKHRVGDVEAVREVLAGGDTIVGADTAAAVGGGLVWVHVVSVLAAIGCLWAALALRRHTERRELSGRSRRS